MKTDCELFIMPSVGLESWPQNGWRTKTDRLLQRCVERFLRIAQPDACTFLYGKDAQGLTRSQSIQRAIPTERVSEYAAANTAVRCVESVCRHAEDRGQICVFLSPRLIILDDTVARKFMYRAAATEGLLTTIWAENKHPCLILREEEIPKDYTWAHNYRTHKLEAPGLWHLDERGEYPIDSRTGQAIMHRQQLYPVYSLKHALFAMRFDRLKDFSQILLDQMAEPFVLAQNTFIFISTIVDLLKAYHRMSLSQSMPISTVGNSGPAAWSSKSNPEIKPLGNYA